MGPFTTLDYQMTPAATVPTANPEGKQEAKDAKMMQPSGSKSFNIDASPILSVVATIFAFYVIIYLLHVVDRRLG